MGDSLRSVGAWIGVISFFAAVIAVANTRIQSLILWRGLELWVAVVVFYCLIKLIRAVISMRRHPTRTYGREKRRFQPLKDRKQYLKKGIVQSFTSQQQQTSKRKSADFELPPLAGFNPQQLQKPTDKKPHQESSPSKGFASQQQQAAKRKNADFELLPLTGFDPLQLQKSTNKKPR